jgi:hypothetical protein
MHARNTAAAGSSAACRFPASRPHRLLRSTVNAHGLCTNALHERNENVHVHVHMHVHEHVVNKQATGAALKAGLEEQAAR